MRVGRRVEDCSRWYQACGAAHQTSPWPSGEASREGAGLEADSGTGCCEHPGKRRVPGQRQDGKGQRPRGQGQNGCVSPECPWGAHLMPTRIHLVGRWVPKNQPSYKYVGSPGDGTTLEAGPLGGTKNTEPPTLGVQQGRSASSHAQQPRELLARVGRCTTWGGGGGRKAGATLFIQFCA